MTFATAFLLLAWTSAANAQSMTSGLPVNMFLTGTYQCPGFSRCVVWGSSAEINVPAQATRMDVSLERVSGTSSINIYGSFGASPSVGSSSIVSDFSTANNLTLTAGSGLRTGGTYYFRLANIMVFVFQQTFSEQARLTVTLYSGATPIGGLVFHTLPPCRVMETRAEYNFQNRAGAYGPPFLRAGETRTLATSASTVCPIPPAAKALVLNVTVVPKGTLDFVTLFPDQTSRPEFWTVRSPDGQIVANSAVVPIANGGIKVYSSHDTDLLLDISGYFAEPGAAANPLTYYPLTPCRVVDTRIAYRTPPGPFGPPSMARNESRQFRLPATPYCAVPQGAAAYSVTLTAVPPGPLAFMTLWPSGTSQPAVSSINSFAGRVLANNVIVPVTADGSMDVFAFDPTDFLIDINGYFAPDDGVNGLAYFPVRQCRMSTTNMAGASTRTEPVLSSSCDPIPPKAKAYWLNFTAIPNGTPMPFLTAWPTNQTQPNASVLNAFQGQTVTNGAIIPAGLNGSIDLYVYRQTAVAVEISGFFAR